MVITLRSQLPPALLVVIDSQARTYFWRTTQQQEIDYLEEQEGAISAWKLRWNPNAKARFPKPFMTTYTPAQTSIVHRDNFEAFVGAG